MFGNFDKINLSQSGNAHDNIGFLSPPVVFGNKYVDKIIERNQHLSTINKNVCVTIESPDIEYILQKISWAKVVVISFDRDDLKQMKYNVLCKLWIEDYVRLNAVPWKDWCRDRGLDENTKPWELSYEFVDEECCYVKESIIQKDYEMGSIYTNSFAYDGDDDRVINIDFKRIMAGDISIIEDLTNFLGIQPVYDVTDDLIRYADLQPKMSREHWNELVKKKQLEYNGQ